jgi:hypothetical protein
MGRFFRIRNFERFQHYKDRNPPWIRLYGGLWRDRAFFRLPDAVKAHLIGLFALAARLDNRIPEDPEWLAHELCASEPIDFAALIASGFLVPEEHPASSALADRRHHDTRSVSDSDLSCGKPMCGESVSEAGSGGDGREVSLPAQAKPEANEVARPALDRTGDAGAYDRAMNRRKGKRPEARWPDGFALNESMRQFAAALGIDAEAEFDAWRDDCAAHDRRYADWEAAWRGRCRNALRFGGRGGTSTRASPAEGAMQMALRRLREASQRERSEVADDGGGRQANHDAAGGGISGVEAE